MEKFNSLCFLLLLTVNVEEGQGTLQRKVGWACVALGTFLQLSELSILIGTVSSSSQGHGAGRGVQRGTTAVISGLTH